MGEAGHRVLPAEGTIEEHVEGCRGEPLLTTDHVADFHQVVIDDVGEVIGGEFVGTLVEHLVVKDRGVDDHVAADDVVNVDLLAGLNLEAHGIDGALLDEAFYLVGGHRERVAHLHAGGGVVLEVGHLFALRVEFLGGIECDVGLAGVEELLHILLVDIAALALAVGTLVATEADALIELDAEPLEGLDDVLLGSGHKALGVGILNTKDELSAVLTGKEIIRVC